MANQNASLPPLYEKIWLKYTFSRVMDSFIMLLLLSLLDFRALSYDKYTNFTWFLAFLCESWFTFTWLLTISTKWNPAHTITYLDRLLSRVPELPPVDLFVTTADPKLEPPIITVKIVLSLLALDYPAHKLACYVSDDACSPLNLYALVEASKFAQLWVPSCKKYNIQVRAPFRYFSGGANPNDSEGFPEFKQQWLRMKDEYEHLSRKIQNATQKSIVLDEEFAIFSTTQHRNHPTIINGKKRTPLVSEGKDLVNYALINAIAIRKILKKYDKIHYSKQGQVFKSQVQSMHKEILQSPWLCELMAFHINLRETKAKSRKAHAIFNGCSLTFKDGKPTLTCEIFDSIKIDIDLTCSICLVS